MHSPNGRYTIVFNGELYNYRSLRCELEELGHIFRTSSDTEVLLSAYSEWGLSSLDRLHGMFAFAVYDTEEHSVTLARDPLGIKPLYFSTCHRKFVFGSEIKAILCDSSISRRANLKPIADLLVLGYPIFPDTFFSDIKELEPGHWLVADAGGIRSGHYWSWTRSPEPMSFRRALDRTEESLAMSIEEHLVADVPVGAFLSGGIDSSLVCAIVAAKLGRKIDVFTVAYADRKHDESNVAREVAKRLGLRHHVISVDQSVVDIELIEAVLGQYDQPFGDSSAIPTYILSEEISKHVKVVLSGDGGDEMFGGYSRFRYAELARLLDRKFGNLLRFVKLIAKSGRRLFPDVSRAIVRLIDASTQTDMDRLTWLSCYCSVQELERVLAKDLYSRIDYRRPGLSRLLSSSDPGGAEFMDVTISAVLPADYLRKIDVASSAHGLEVRVPYLGSQVLDVSASLENKHKFDRNQTKIIPRALLDRYLPSDISHLPKSGFSVPLNRILHRKQKEAIRNRLLDSSLLSEVVNREYIGDVTRAFVENDWARYRYSEFSMYQRVYALLALDVWANKWNPVL